MKTTQYIAVTEVSKIYNVEISFLSTLKEMGLIECILVSQTECIHTEAIHDVEKMIRMHQDLSVNPEGIDIIFNLLEKVDQMDRELKRLHNRIQFHENPK